MRLWPCSHDWLPIGPEDRHRTCPACYRTEVRRGDRWVRLRGVSADNWHGVVRRISLDGCDSLAEHREMLARRSDTPVPVADFVWPQWQDQPGPED